MQYTDYAVEDFLLDESFRNYCLGKQEKDVNFWEAWIAAHPGKYEEVRQAKELYFIINGNIKAGQFREHQQQFETMLQQHITAGNTSTAELPPFSGRQINYWKRTLWIASLAAAAVLAFIFIPGTGKPVATQQAPLKYEYSKVSNAGERKSFQLPDGSKVMLNAGSTINIAQNFNEQTREITLEGEAFFDVTHNPAKPFIIHTSSMDVKVLGTTFNVKAYASDKITETSLIKGSVEITLNKSNRKKIILHPNEKIVLPNIPVDAAAKKGSGSNGPAAVDYRIADLTYINSELVETSWTEDRLAFNEDSFEEIAAKLSRWYNVSIRVEDEEIKQYRFTATFDQKTITQVLDALQLSRHFDYKIEENNRIVIRK